MMKAKLAAITVLLLVFWGTGRAEAMRCGTELITEGSTKFEVLRACGEPLAVYGRDTVIGTDGLTFGGIYEKWIYDIGGGVFHILYFDGFQVQRIEIKRK